MYKYKYGYVRIVSDTKCFTCFLQQYFVSDWCITHYAIGQKAKASIPSIIRISQLRTTYVALLGKTG